MFFRAQIGRSTDEKRAAELEALHEKYLGFYESWEKVLENELRT